MYPSNPSGRDIEKAIRDAIDKLNTAKPEVAWATPKPEASSRMALRMSLMILVFVVVALSLSIANTIVLWSR